MTDSPDTSHAIPPQSAWQPTDQPASPPTPQTRPSSAIFTLISLVAVLGLVVAVVALVVAINADKTATVARQQTPAPATVVLTQPAPAASETTVQGPSLTAAALAVPGVIVGPDGQAVSDLPQGPAVRVDIFSDYLCPYCRDFDTSNAALLQQLVDQGQINLVIHPVAILDRLSNGTNYSTRAAQAAMTVANLAPKSFSQFHAGLFAQQPAENTDGLTDQQIAAIADTAGVSQEVIDQLTSATTATTIADLTEQAGQAGMSGTPTVSFTGADGQPVLWDYSTPIDQMVQQIAGQ